MHRRTLVVVLASIAVSPLARAADDPALPSKLKEIDAYAEKVLKDWNVPGFGLGIVVKDRLVYARGYGFRDYGKKLPFTPKTVVPIGSNTKLFTAVSAGILVEDGKLEWDKPVRQFVPQIRFYDDALTNTVTIRDMLSHRTGITRHDTIGYKSDLTRQELFERLRYLEPTQPIRQTYLYNNMMYMGAGRVVEILSGQTWEEFVRRRILGPLGMTSTVFSIDDLLKQPDHGVPFTERRDSFELHQVPYQELGGMGPAGSMSSNLENLSRWAIALLNEGKIDGKTALPAGALKQVRAPSIAMPNVLLEARGWGEILNPVYAAGCQTSSYRGHLMVSHGGDVNGFHSKVSIMPQDGIGVIVLVIGNHAGPIYNYVSYNVFEKLLGMSETPWMERGLDIRKKGKEAGKQARAKAGAGRVAGTRPSHGLDDYAGEFVHPAYGVLTIGRKGDDLLFGFHKIELPLRHFHYDRFDTPDDEEEGQWSVNFFTSPQGEVDKALVSLDEAEVVFTRRAPAGLSALETLRLYAGTYESPTGGKLQVVLKEAGELGLVFPSQSFQALQPWKKHRFRVKEFSDVEVEFVMVGGRVTALKHIFPSGEYVSVRK